MKLQLVGLFAFLIAKVKRFHWAMHWAFPMKWTNWLFIISWWCFSHHLFYKWWAQAHPQWVANEIRHIKIKCVVFNWLYKFECIYFSQRTLIVCVWNSDFNILKFELSFKRKKLFVRLFLKADRIVSNNTFSFVYWSGQNFSPFLTVPS